MLGPELGAEGRGCTAQSEPASSSSQSARISIMPVPSVCSAKHADNPLIHKPTHCHAISGTVDGGGGEKIEFHFSATFLSKSVFPFPGYDIFLFSPYSTFSPHLPLLCELFFLSYSLHSPPLLCRGHCATRECY